MRCSFLSCKEVRITIFLEEVFLTEGVSYKRVPYKDFQIWCSFIEKSVSYIEGVSYRECILQGGSTVSFNFAIYVFTLHAEKSVVKFLVFSYHIYIYKND